MKISNRKQGQLFTIMQALYRKYKKNMKEVKSDHHMVEKNYLQKEIICEAEKIYHQEIILWDVDSYVSNDDNL